LWSEQSARLLLTYRVTRYDICTSATILVAAVMLSGKGLGMLPRKSEFNLGRYICTLSTVKQTTMDTFLK